MLLKGFPQKPFNSQIISLKLHSHDKNHLNLSFHSTMYSVDSAMATNQDETIKMKNNIKARSKVAMLIASINSFVPLSQLLPSQFDQVI